MAGSEQDVRPFRGRARELARFEKLLAGPEPIVNVYGLKGAGVSRFVEEARGLGLLDSVTPVIEHDLDKVLESGDRAIVASRTPLHAPGVARLALGPLPPPPRPGSCDHPSVQIFLDAWAELGQAWEPDPPNVAAVTEICTAVGGLPGVLKIAAGRAAVFGLTEFANLCQTEARLLDVFGTGPDSPREWLREAWLACPPAPRRLFVLLGVFAESFTVQAARRVAGEAVYGDLEALLEHQLVRRCCAGPDGAPRFELPPMLRALARELLDSDPAAAETHERHATALLETLRELAAAARDARPQGSPAVLRLVGADARALLSRLAENGKDEALEVAAALMPLALQSGGIRDLADVLGDLVARSEEAPPLVRSDGQCALAALLLGSATAPDLLALGWASWQEGLATARAAGDHLRVLHGIPIGLRALAVAGDVHDIEGSAREGLELATRIGHARWRARYLAWLGMCRHQAQDLEAAASLGSRALAAALRCEDDVAVILAGLLLHPLPPDVRSSEPLLPDLTELAELAERHGERGYQGLLLGLLALEQLADGNPLEATRHADSCLHVLSEAEGWRGACYATVAMVQVASARGDHETAARLHGGIGPLADVLVANMAPAHGRRYRQAVDLSRTALGVDRFEGAEHAGASGGLREAVSRTARYAARIQHDALERTGSRQPRLTARETQVMALLVRGLTNKEIAKSLGISPKSVMHHCSAIYRKLRVTSRSGATTYALQHGLLADQVSSL